MDILDRIVGSIELIWNFIKFGIDFIEALISFVPNPFRMPLSIFIPLFFTLFALRFKKEML